MLMLATALMATGIAQAQSKGKHFAITVVSAGDPETVPHLNTEPYEFTYAIDKLSADDQLAQFTIPDSNTPDPAFAEVDSVYGLSGNQGIAVGSGTGDALLASDGYMLTGADAKLFKIDGNGAVTVTSEGVKGLNNPDSKSIFTFNVKIAIDNDPSSDSGKGIGNSPTPDHGDIGQSPGRTNDPADDHDMYAELPVIVRVLKLAEYGENLTFAATSTDVQSEPVMGINDNGEGYSRYIEVRGLPSDAKVMAVNANADTSGMFGAKADKQNRISIMHEAPPTGLSDAGSEDEESIHQVDLGITVTHKGENLQIPRMLDIDGDAVLDKYSTAYVKVLQPLMFTSPTGDMYAFNIESNAGVGTTVGSIRLLGAFDKVPGDVVNGDAEIIVLMTVKADDLGPEGCPFSAVPEPAGGAGADTAVIKVMNPPDGGLKPGEYKCVVIANGTFSSTRLAKMEFSVWVAPSDAAPTTDGEDDDGASIVKGTDGMLTLSKTIAESATSKGLLIKAKTGEGANEEKRHLLKLSDYVDDNGGKLTYEVESNGTPFTLVADMYVGLSDDLMAAKKMTPADENAEDDESTDYVDESKTYYTIGQMGKFSNGESATNVMHDDITYEFEVKYKDAALNNGEFTVKLTVDVNEPVALTKPVPSEPIKYTSLDPVGYDILKIAEYVTARNGEEYKYQIIKTTPETAHLRVTTDGVVEVAFKHESIPSTDNWDAETDGWKVTVTVNDPFENSPIRKVPSQADSMKMVDDSDGKLADDVTITFTVVRIQKDIDTEELNCSIDENSPATTALKGDDGKPCSLAGVMEDAASYKIDSASYGTKGKYAIDDTGAVTTTVGDLNYETAVNDDSDRSTTVVSVKDVHGTKIGTILVNISVSDVNEPPAFADATAAVWVSESAAVGSPVKVSSETDAPDFKAMATDEDGDTLAYTTDSKLFDIAGGKLVVKEGLDADSGPTSHTVVITASDGELSGKQTVTVTVGNANDDPEFVDPTPNATGQIVPIEKSSVVINENAIAHVVDFKVEDKDGAANMLKFSLDDGVSQNLFEIKNAMRSKDDATIWTGELWTKVPLDFEGSGAYPYNHSTGYSVLVQVNDGKQGDDTLTVHVKLNDVNDNKPMFKASNKQPTVSVNENTARGTVIGTYEAEDADGSAPNNTVTYSIIGDDAKSFSIDEMTGKLTTLASLDFDSTSAQNTPCNGNSCTLTIVAKDGGTPALDSTYDKEVSGSGHINLTINLVDSADSVSSFAISKANPIANISSPGDDAGTALADAKSTMSKAVPESPADLPANGMVDSNGDGDYDDPGESNSAPRNFVRADWANWGTVLRIEVTAQSPDPACGNGNQCVFVDVEADSSDDKLQLQAFRSSGQENRFITAVKLVEDEADSTPYTDEAVYKHTDGSVAALEVDEEDDVEFRLHGSKIAPVNVEVENEAPEFNNFMPEHEAAFDDGDVDYTFTVIDPVSGIPEPEDLPDTNGDGDYMPLVALVSNEQCHIVGYNNDGSMQASPGKAYSDYHFAGNGVWCKSAPEIRAITDDRDFDEIDDGFEVDTKIVLDPNKRHFVTFVVCDSAGNCELYTPDENDTDAALAEITIDTDNPKFVEARTGIKWDSTDSEYDDDRKFIQVLFEDLTALDPTTIEADDFVVEGHTVKDAHWYDVSDNDDDTRWGDKNSDGSLNMDTTPTRYALGGPKNIGGRGLLRQNIRNAVFLELEDELAPDETPDVSVVPNGVGDSAGNEQDDGEQEADDWIAPSFTMVVNPTARTPEGSSNVLAGDNDEVVINLSSDERIVKTRPDIIVTYVNAPAGCVETATRLENLTKKASDGSYSRGEIIILDDKAGCGKAATGGELGTTIEKVSNTEWTVTVDEPSETGYYNIYVSAQDRSANRNEGSEGVSASKIATNFFERDGDVNSDDAYYFQGDRNLASPKVMVSGVRIEDTEPSVEFKTPLFVEIDFTDPYLDDCRTVTDKDDRKAKCYAESDEYAKDSFDSVTIDSVTLNGADITDSVKTTDDETFLLAIDGIAIGDHEIEIQATDLAGNSLDKTLSIEFEVEERDAFSQRLNPGWNLVSIPGEPADSDISVVFGNDMQVRTVYTYNPIIPGGWMVAVRESADSEWQGDLTEITARQGYWVLSDAIQDWEVSIPRLAGGAVGSGTPIQPPVIALYAGWNLVPVIDVTGNFDSKGADGVEGISAQAYLQSLDDGLDLARVLGFNTITNTWSTVMAPEGGDSDTLAYGRAYWVFVRQAASLVPGN
jgi:hypothetical protein